MNHLLFLGLIVLAGIGFIVAGVGILAGAGWSLISGGIGMLLIAFIFARGAQHGE